VDTDLLGAYRGGLQSLFVASAVYAPAGLTTAAITDLFAERPFAPIAAMPALAW
jgi:hypothetical protein